MIMFVTKFRNYFEICKQTIKKIDIIVFFLYINYIFNHEQNTF